MTPQTRLIAIAGGAAFVVAAAVALWFTMADRTVWSPETRADFMRHCTDSCRKAPGVTEDKYPLCDRICTCDVDESEKTMSPRALALAEKAVGDGTATTEQTEKINRIIAAGKRCAAEASAPEKK